MTQIPNISVETLDQYDNRLIDPNAQKLGEKKRKDQFKRLIAGTVGVMPPLATREQCFIISHWRLLISHRLAAARPLCSVAK